MSVILYTKPQCHQCTATKNYFTQNGILFTTIDISEDAEAYRHITEDLGATQAPVVEVTDIPDWNGPDHWSGLQPTVLRQLKKALQPG